MLAYGRAMVYAWENDQEGYDEWCDGLVLNAPESWDGDDSQEFIITEYVRHLEVLVTSAYGPEGLERYHGGVADTVDMWNQMRMLQEWLSKHMPHIRQAQGVAGPIISLLDICHTTISTVVPVLQSIASVLIPKLRDAGLVKRCSCDPGFGDKTESGRHHAEKCPMRTGWI